MCLNVFYYLVDAGVDDRIDDGFMDVGQLRPGTKLKTLEQYYKDAVNQKRCILLINAKPE